MRGASGELAVDAERMSCPYCTNGRAVLNGRREGKQIYRCRGCGKQFREGGAIGGHSFPPDQIGAAIQMCYTGWSLRKAAKALKDQFGIQDADVSPETIRNWVDSYTDAAIRLVRDLKVPGDGLWWVFTIRTTNNKPLCRLVLDDTTGYIFGDEFGRIKEGDLGMMEVDGANTYAIFRNKEEVSVVQPPPDWRSALGSREFCTGYRRGEWIGDGSVQHTEGPRGYTLGLTLPKIFNEYIGACVGFERYNDPGNIRQRLAGWVITRNLFTEQMELDGRTPGQAAGIESPIAAWADVVRLEARAFLPTVDPKAAVATPLPSKDPASEGNYSSQG